MRSPKGLTALLADLEARAAITVFKGVGGTVVGTIIAGNSEVAWVKDRSGVVHYVVLAGLGTMFELEGSGYEALYPGAAALN